jgi:hypothetical protein
MSGTFQNILRTSRIWLPATSLVLYNSLIKSRLDESGNSEAAIAATKLHAKIARREEILRAAREFAKFADSSPSGQH